MTALLGIGLFLCGAGIGLAVGWVLPARRMDALRRERALVRAEVRNHVLPVLEERASAAGVPPHARAHDVSDALEAAVAIGRAIRELESRRDLPFTDTLELSRADVTAEVERKERA